jgi:MFS family permease
VSYAAVIWQLQHLNLALLHPTEIQPRSPGMLVEGVRYVRSQPKMVLILIMVFFAGTFGMNFQITSALMATEVFGKGAGEFGILGSAMAVGSLTGALMAARRVTIRLRLLVFAALGFGAAEVVAGLLPSYVAFAVFAPVIGFCTLTLLNSANATMQLESDPALRGRVMALYMTIVMGGTPFGSPVVGWIGEHFGARYTLVVGGLLTMGGVLLAVLVFARLSGGLRTVLTPAQAPSNLVPRVWDSQTVARASGPSDPIATPSGDGERSPDTHHRHTEQHHRARQSAGF